MALSAGAKAALHALLFQNANWANVGDATGLRGSSTAGSLYVSLHTADPTSGDQTTSETAYTNYARVAVARSSGGWTVVGSNTVQNASDLLFPQCGATGATLTHFAIGTASSGAGTIVGVGTITLAVSLNILPEFLAGQLTAVVT